MQRTTSQQTSPRKRTNSFAFAFALALAGCRSSADKVYVDLSTVTLQKVATVDPVAASEGNRYSGSVELPSLDERELFIGSAEDRAREALDVYRKAQEEAVKGVLARLEKSYSIEAARTLKEGQSEIEKQHNAEVDLEIDRLRTDFEKHAETMGTLRNDLTAIVGFPDPDPKSVRVPPTHDKEATAKFNKARGVRTLIEAANQAYTTLVRSRLGALEDKQKSMIEALSKQSDTDRAEVVRRAQAEALAVAQQAQAVLERSALAPETQLPAVPGAATSVDSLPVAAPPFTKAAPVAESPESLREQLNVFLRVMNYRLVDSPKKGRDATQEFVEWRQKYANER